MRYAIWGPRTQKRAEAAARIANALLATLTIALAICLAPLNPLAIPCATPAALALYLAIKKSGRHWIITQLALALASFIALTTVATP